VAGSRAAPSKQLWDELASYVLVLYEEMDKLAKKAPSAPVSDLALKRVNLAVADARSLMAKHDRYIAEIEPFVPAGENPEVRDAVLILREIKQGLLRVNDKLQLKGSEPYRLK
jgi:hypothetical protein